MTDRKLRPTSFDYALAALSPVLIILMIGSLVYFLITMLYRGDFHARLMWILGLFTMASVLITRIAIEQSRTQSFTYLGLLSAATLLVAPRFFVLEGSLAPLSIPILIGFLAMIVFLADRITMDCTSVDDAHDSHGFGLLQSLGIFKRTEVSEPTGPTDAPSRVSDLPKSLTKESRNHNPGVWILYFALLALPVFGLGQFFLPSGSAQRVALACLVIYLGSALALLVMISLLALRQYVRQRDVEMQTGMSWNWLATGIGSVLGLVVLMAILPLPMLESSNWELPFKLSSREGQTPSQWGWGNEGVKQPQQQQPQQQQPQQQQPQQQQPQQQQPQQTWNPPSIDWNFGALFRWLMIAILAIVSLVFGAKYFRQWLAWFHREDAEVSEETQLASSAPTQASRAIRFSELDDPFKLHRNEPDEIIRSLFHAVSVWGKEHRVARAEDETPDEYSRRLGRKYAEISESLTQLGLLVSRLAYAKKSVNRSDANSLQPLWDWLRTNQQ